MNQQSSRFDDTVFPSSNRTALASWEASSSWSEKDVV